LIRIFPGGKHRRTLHYKGGLGAATRMSPKPDVQLIFLNLHCLLYNFPGAMISCASSRRRIFCDWVAPTESKPHPLIRHKEIIMQQGNQPNNEEIEKKAGNTARPDDNAKEAPAGNENANPVGNPNDVGTTGDYSR
jgi:hypothetical protein